MFFLRAEEVDRRRRHHLKQVLICTEVKYQQKYLRNPGIEQSTTVLPAAYNPVRHEGSKLLRFSKHTYRYIPLLYKTTSQPQQLFPFRHFLAFLNNKVLSINMFTILLKKSHSTFVLHVVKSESSKNMTKRSMKTVVSNVKILNHNEKEIKGVFLNLLISIMISLLIDASEMLSG